jgi:hypothetical protein
VIDLIKNFKGSSGFAITTLNKKIDNKNREERMNQGEKIDKYFKLM